MGKIVEYLGFQADSDNLPLSRPGVYQLINQVNGKSYIGISQNVARRIKDHSDSKQRKLGNALRKHRASQFLIHPIAYSIDNKTDWLPVLEAQLIVEFDTVKNGYNVQEASNNVGPYGEEFSKIITEVNNRPEVKQRFLELQKKLWSDPNYKPDRSYQKKFASDLNGAFQQKGREARQRPEIEEKRRANITKTWQSPEFRQKQSQDKINKLQDAEFRAVHLERFTETRRLGTIAAGDKVRGSIWINDGAVNKRLTSGENIPEGWVVGRFKRLRRVTL